MFDMFKSPKNDEETKSSTEPKISLYRRFVESKRDEISEADVAKYTGMSKDELKAWAQDKPGVAGNQAAGAITAGTPSGLGSQHAADGFGGWGSDSIARSK